MNFGPGSKKRVLRIFAAGSLRGTEQDRRPGDVLWVLVAAVWLLVAGGASATAASRAGASNYQDLWWNPAESGWGG